MDAEFDVRLEESIVHAADKFGISTSVKQKTALTNFLRGHDVFVSLPTGSGKSFIFQAAPICTNYIKRQRSVSPSSIAIVVSPIKALIDDQIKKLKEAGVVAATLGEADLENKNLSVIFASPESLLEENGKGRDTIISLRERICGIFVDECHIVPKWGYASTDKTAFRKHFAMLGEVRALIPAKVPLVALTATATEENTKSIVKTLAMYDVVYVVDSPDRSNIKYVSVRTKTKEIDDMFQWLVNHLKEHNEKGTQAERIIVYCRTLSQCRELYGFFESEMEETKSFAMFHSETTSDIQEEVIKSFSEVDGDIRILFATIAFGMGIDVKGLHTIIHLGVPSDVESFLQESGRAGRDGVQSVSILLMYTGMFKDSRVTEPMKEYVANRERCRRKEILSHFATASATITYTCNHTCCDVCAATCKCGEDGCNDKPMPYRMLAELSSKSQNLEQMGLPTRIMTEDDRNKLKLALLDYRMQKLNIDGEGSTQVSHEGATNYLAGADISSGLPLQCINNIVTESQFVLSYDVFSNRYAIYADSRRVYDICKESMCECPIEEHSETEDLNNDSSVTASTDESSCHSDEEDGIGNECVYFEGEYANMYIRFSSDESQSEYADDDDIDEDEEDEDESDV